ncbi:YfbU family protein [Burkholderia cenocepacia]|uniref:YfbU family protein n=1 Tax=Burkholderia cenocepacia TaxID=95486 RepID=UPI0028663363|nr:YfbU family protein [Burkholderia cenocepacia]MDR8077782.1 YfbU family protein [Burkholderia cenocepacia]
MPPKSERFELRLDEEQLARIDEWAREQGDNGLSRAAAIRELIDIGLSAGSKGSVRFTDGEKMLMLMMSDVFKALKIKEPDSDPHFLAEVIYGGHYWAPKWDMQGVFHDHVDNPRDVRHVVDVLDMWSFIEEAYEKFSAEQKAAIAEQVGPWGKHVAFTGFDGNNESSQLGIARFLVNKMDRFTRFKGRDLNSHHPTYDRYSRMVELFEPMRAALIGHGLSVQQIVTLLKT